jgi:hypothetical protein
MMENLDIKALDVIEKSGKPAQLGEIRVWGGKRYHKTPKGWRAVPKGYRETKQDPAKIKYQNKNDRYKPKATHIWIDGLKDNKEKALRAMQAMKDIQGGYAQGTPTNPSELTSSYVKKNDKGRWVSDNNGDKTLIQAILSGDEVDYNDGWYIVETDGDVLYVDVTGQAMNENPDDYKNMEYVTSEGLEPDKEG